MRKRKEVQEMLRQLTQAVLLGCVLLESPRVLEDARAAEQADASSRDAEYRRLVVGTWEDEYEGKRTMTVRADGTATMIVDLRGWKAALYASRLTFQMVWSIHDGRFQKRTTGGEPSGKVNAILKLMGDRVEERILELTQDRLLLLDQNGKRKYDWHRVKKGG